MEIAKTTGTLNGKKFVLALKVDGDGDKATVSLDVTANGEDASLTVDVSYTPSGPKFSVPTFSVDTATATCLAGCGLGAIKPIIECAHQNNNVQDFITCVRSKGLSILLDAATCLLPCLSGAAPQR